MAVSVSEQKAACYMAKVRAEMVRFEALSEQKYFDSGYFDILVKCAWVRAVVLGELASPAEVEDRAGDVVLEMQQFVGAVYALQGQMNMENAVFQDMLEEAEEYVEFKQECQMMVDSGTATVASMSSAGMSAVDFPGMILCAAYATYESHGEVPSGSAVFEDDRVGFFPVYPKQVHDQVFSGAVGDGYVRLSAKSSSGSMYLDPCGEIYKDNCLPDVNYVLRQQSEVTLTLPIFKRVLRQVVEIPKLTKKDGFCYLAAVPVAMRGMVADTLGAYPCAASLRRLLPSCGHWCAKPVVYVRKKHFYHFTATGHLPEDIPEYSIIGAGPVDQEADQELRGVLSRLHRLRATSVVRRDSVASGFMPTSIIQGDDSFMSVAVDDDSVGNVKSVGFSCVDHVSTLPPASDLFRPSDKHAKRDDALVLRLDAGGPISDSYLRKVDNRYGVGRCFPATRTEHGRVVLLPQGDEGPTTTTGSWRVINAATGWNVSRLSLRRVKPVSAFDVVVGRNAAARVDLSAASVVVVGGLRLPGQATTVWFQSSLSLVTTSPGGSVSLAVPMSGAATGPGWLASTAVAMYRCVYVKSYDEIDVRTDNVVTLKDGPQKSSYGLVRTLGQVNLRGVGCVPLRIVSDEGRSGMAIFVISGSGLRAVIVAGVEVPAVHGTVCVAVDGWANSMELYVTAPGKFKFVADFVADPASLEAKLRFSPVTPTAPYSFGS